MPGEQRGTSTRTHDLLRAAAGVAVMLLGVGATLMGWLVSLGVAIGMNPTGPFRLGLVSIPVASGFGLYFVGVAVAGKSRAGAAASVGMGTAVLLFGAFLYVWGFTDDRQDPVLLLFWGAWLVGLGVASVAVGATRDRSAKSKTPIWRG